MTRGTYVARAFRVTRGQEVHSRVYAADLFLQHATSDKERYGSATASLLYYFLFQSGVLATVPASAGANSRTTSIHVLKLHTEASARVLGLGVRVVGRSG